jgi:hypothetical protein
MIYLSIFFLYLIYFLLFYRKSARYLGSDHALHVKLIQAIRKNQNRFCTRSPFSVNEKTFAYPQLFHWLLSFLPTKIYLQKPHVINLWVKILDIATFNLFAVYLVDVYKLPDVYLVFANIVYNLFPISYSAWNSKNMGISTRHAGLVFGQLYVYLLFVYVQSGSAFVLPLMAVVVFCIILLSQMALQYVLFTLPLFAVCFKMPELVSVPIFAFAAFFALMPEVAKNYIIGQYNHKRNYALFLAEIYILKKCYSIWRDFVYDFWITLKNEKNKYLAIFYISKNPVVEIIYGMPFLWFVLYSYFYSESQSKTQTNVLTEIVLCSFAVFLLTTFRKTRFLGEPQRYLEFTVPAIAVLFVVTQNQATIFWASLYGFITILVYLFAFKKSGGNEMLNEPFYNMAAYLHDKYGSNKTVVSNDGEQLRFLLLYGFDICQPSLTGHYKSKHDFQKQFYSETFKSISPEFINQAIKTHQADLVILNEKLYGADLLLKNCPNVLNNYLFENKVQDFAIFKLKE